MSESINHKTEALEMAEVTDDYRTVALVHAIVHLADQVTALREQLPTLAMLHTPLDGITDSKATREMPKLRNLLSGQSAEQENTRQPVILSNGRPYRPAHDPREWKADPATGDWISPAGRRFSPTSHQVLGVIRRLEQMRKKGTLYTAPLRTSDDQGGSDV